MTIDRRLLALLVCPVCKGPLTLWRDAENRAHELLCPADHVAYPIRDGIPVMLESEGRAIDEAEQQARTRP